MLEMREIEAFLSVAEELHFGRAAQRLRLSTSRVSVLVRAVERRAGAQLFERSSRVVRLTPQGAQLYAGLRAAYVQIERVLDDVRRAGGHGGVLRVGFATTLPQRLRTELISTFESRYPDCRVVASSLPTPDLFRWIGKEWPVAAFVTWMPVASVPLAPPLHIGPVVHRVQRAVLLGAGHPLAGKDSVDIDDLAAGGHPVIYPELPPWLGGSWTPGATPAGQPLTLRRMPAPYVEDVLRLVADGELAHLTFASLLEVHDRPGVVLTPLTGLPPMPIRTVWAPGPHEHLAEAFADHAGRAAPAEWLGDPSPTPA
ncbi:LysR family transcriptional regulator [Yinghuangia seranimata]|uniref:LysR family transcriptional regulator n=1 Tax=Yinghuangia seranimata TaxID=408067 RepID=UPI00248B8A9E|nr:LysR family transcriptional regulator [Yinghuangia seranimata]MDI2131290.1 LysR family transcriptional regulator [Yinghuangia seranimata]